jgi:hypothetical protein
VEGMPQMWARLPSRASFKICSNPIAEETSERGQDFCKSSTLELESVRRADSQAEVRKSQPRLAMIREVGTVHNQQIE